MRRRLDVEMVRRGMATNPAEAQRAIRSGLVSVSGRPAGTGATLVQPDEPISIRPPGRRLASRGGEKLAAALDRFQLDPRGLPALDAGASAGGFTDCLLARGAQHVVAVDVGYGQLDWRLREDPRVMVLERTNVRDLDPTTLPYLAELVTADLSFISLGAVVSSLVRCSGPEARFVLLVKPQFEARREEVEPGGVVRDPAVWRRVLAEVSEACRREGLRLSGVMPSPVLGPAGNVEFFISAGREGSAGSPRQEGPAEGIRWAEAIEAAVSEAERMAKVDG